MSAERLCAVTAVEKSSSPQPVSVFFFHLALVEKGFGA
jgi:hypothetical protein